MCTVKIQWVAMETVSFQIAKMSFFLDITYLVVQSEQFGSHEKLSWGSRQAKLAAGLLALSVNILPILKMGGVILSDK